MNEIKAPFHRKKGQRQAIFLGGSIEMGKAVNWQKELVSKFERVKNLVFYNPRRDDWDVSLPQDPTPGSHFHTQVEWEMDAQLEADLIVYYFDKDTVSPITLLELGQFGSRSMMMSKNRSVVVCCPKEYFRYGNVAIFCETHKITLYHEFDELVDHIDRNFNNTPVAF
jgi:hypothetical protein